MLSKRKKIWIATGVIVAVGAVAVITLPSHPRTDAKPEAAHPTAMVKIHARPVPPVAVPLAPDLPRHALLKNRMRENETASRLVRSVSAGEAVPVTTFDVQDGLIGVIYKTVGVVGVNGKPIYSTAWVLPRKRLVILGRIIDGNGNIIEGQTAFAMQALKHPQAQDHTAVTAATASSGGDSEMLQEETAALMNAKGENGIPAAMAKSPGMLAAALSPVNSFVEGSAGPIFTIFANPDNEESLQLFTALQAPVKKGELRIRWVPIGTGKASLGRSEYILSQPSPLSAWKVNFQKYNEKTHAGGVPAEQNDRMAEIVDGNTEILARMGEINPITGFYCSKQSSEAVKINGPITAQSLLDMGSLVGNGCA